jgi:hypothetical protein
MDVKQKKWRVKRHFFPLVDRGFDFLFLKPSKSPHKKQTLQPGDAIEGTALKPDFEID